MDNLDLYITYFNKHAVPGEKPEDCWRWNLAHSTSGYGQGCIEGKKIDAHRISLIVKMESNIEKGLQVRHKCDNKFCVNPDHLELGTRKDNMKDMYDRGRAKPAGRPPTGKTKKTKKDVPEYLKPFAFTSESMKGENNTRAILTKEDVEEIRRRHGGKWAYGERKKVCEEFGVSASTIDHIIAGLIWKD
jgi:hypothetical protein